MEDEQKLEFCETVSNKLEEMRKAITVIQDKVNEISADL